MTPATAAGAAIPLRRTAIDVVGLLQSIQQVMAPQAKAFDITLRVVIDRRVPPTLFVDRRKIAWALTAVIGNALRYVRHGTSRMPGGSITVTAVADDDMSHVIVEIQDDGPGIPAETIDATNADLDDPRVGLALAMVRDVVVAHAGRLKIESRMDGAAHGTTVQFTLPID